MSFMVTPKKERKEWSLVCSGTKKVLAKRFYDAFEVVKERLTTHCKWRKPELACAICSHTLSPSMLKMNGYGLLCHILKHVDDFCYSCQTCGKNLKRYKYHYKTQHRRKAPFLTIRAEVAGRALDALLDCLPAFLYDIITELKLDSNHDYPFYSAPAEKDAMDRAVLEYKFYAPQCFNKLAEECEWLYQRGSGMNCAICSEILDRDTTAAAVQEHFENHLNPKAFQCLVCGDFSSKISLHQEAVHPFHPFDYPLTPRPRMAIEAMKMLRKFCPNMEDIFALPAPIPPHLAPEPPLFVTFIEKEGAAPPQEETEIIELSDDNDDDVIEIPQEEQEGCKPSMGKRQKLEDDDVIEIPKEEQEEGCKPSTDKRRKLEEGEVKNDSVGDKNLFATPLMPHKRRSTTMKRLFSVVGSIERSPIKSFPKRQWTEPMSEVAPPRRRPKQTLNMSFEAQQKVWDSPWKGMQSRKKGALDTSGIFLL